MKKFYLTLAMATLSLSLCLMMNSCSDDDPTPTKEPEPENPVPAPNPEPEPDPEPEPSDQGTEVKSYFASILNGEDAEMPATDCIDVTDPAAAQAQVWTLWKEAYAQAGAPELTAASEDIYECYYNYYYPVAWKWTLSNSESMDFFYGFHGNKPTEGWPLILSLHGSGEDSQSEYEATIDWDGYNSSVNKENSLYVVPKSPKGGTGCRWYQPTRQQAWEKLLKMAYASGNVDANKVTFKGISEGAYGTQRLASFYADYLAAAVPISGGEPLYSAPLENLANVYFVARTGSEDTSYGRAVCIQKINDELDRLESAHPEYYKHYIDIMDGADHGLDNGNGYLGLTTKALEVSREACPKYFYWENFALGGINGEGYAWRKAFYNIRPLEAQNEEKEDGDRNAYEMSITDNTIDLSVLSVSVKAADYDTTIPTGAMNVGVEKTATPATSGKVRIYLCDKLVDLSKPVIVNVNGSEAYNGEVEVSADAMVESAAIFFDPERIFTAYIDVDVK